MKAVSCGHISSKHMKHLHTKCDKENVSYKTQNFLNDKRIIYHSFRFKMFLLNEGCGWRGVLGEGVLGEGMGKRGGGGGRGLGVSFLVTICNINVLLP